VAAAGPIITSAWPRATRGRVTFQRVDQFRGGVAEVARDPLILMTSLAQAAQFVLNGTLTAFLPLFARDELGLNAAQLGWLFALQTVTTLAARPAMGIVSDRVGRRSVIVCGLSVCSTAVLLIPQTESLPAVVAAVWLYAVGVAVTTAATAAFITDLSRRARYGAAHGVFGTIYDVGDALGPIAAGLLVASVGYVRMFQVIAMFALTITVLFVVASQRQKGRE
jgi:DHA1 family multidrug resistance protein-like MFS transporter